MQTVVISGAGHLLTFHLLSSDISDTKDLFDHISQTQRREFKNATSSGVTNFEMFKNMVRHYWVFDHDIFSIELKLTKTKEKTKK